MASVCVFVTSVTHALLTQFGFNLGRLVQSEPAPPNPSKVKVTAWDQSLSLMLMHGEIWSLIDLQIDLRNIHTCSSTALTSIAAASVCNHDFCLCQSIHFPRTNDTFNNPANFEHLSLQ